MRSKAIVALLAISLTGLPAGASSAATPKGGLPPLPPLAKRCSAPGARATPFRFRASDGTLLDGAVLGRGRVGVVLAHEYFADLCNWLPYGLFLSRAGFRVLLFDFRDFGLSSRVTGTRAARLDADVRGAIAELRRRGAGKVVIVGASIGGSAVLAAAASSRPPVAGVVSISAPDTRSLRADLAEYAAALDPTAAAARIRSPLLFLHAKDDQIVPPTTSTRLYRAATVKDKRLVITPCCGHGTSLIDDPESGPSMRNLVLKFIRDHTGS